MKCFHPANDYDSKLAGFIFPYQINTGDKIEWSQMRKMNIFMAYIREGGIYPSNPPCLHNSIAELVRVGPCSLDTRLIFCKVAA